MAIRSGATPASIRRERSRLHIGFARPILIGLVVGALAACGGSGEQVTFAEMTANPADHDGQRVTVDAGYYGAFEVSVLTSGFAESFPPQPMDPLVWVSAGPPEDCLEDAEGGIRWAEAVEASGVFRYDPEKGFGHLGAYDMTLQDATITCA